MDQEDCDYDRSFVEVEILDEYILNNVDGYDVVKPSGSKNSGIVTADVEKQESSSSGRNGRVADGHELQHPKSSGRGPSCGNSSKRKKTKLRKQEEMDVCFVDVLEKIGKVLLLKSQTPPVREKKKKALEDMQHQLLIQYGLEYSGDEILKKINNMKPSGSGDNSGTDVEKQESSSSRRNGKVNDGHELQHPKSSSSGVSCGNSSKRKRTQLCKQEETDISFVDMLEQVGKVLLLKSQTPPVREKKKKALEAMQHQLLIQYGLEYSGDQILKKINNMKSTVKDKTDTKKTGNVKIVLNKPQQKFYELLGGMGNPSVNNVSYGLAVGTKQHVQEKDPPREKVDSCDDFDSDRSFQNGSPACQPEQQTPKRLAKGKSATRSITQQMVYEEQVKLIVDQQNYTALLQAHQEERHLKEMELLALKKEIAILKIKMLKDNMLV